MLSLPETPALVVPSRCRELLGGLTGRPGPSWVEEGGKMGRHMVKSCLPTSIVRTKVEGVDYSRIYFFLGSWPLHFI
jgi:hypothetical protein